MMDSGITAVGTSYTLSNVAMKCWDSIMDLLQLRYQYCLHYLRYLDYFISAPFFEITMLDLFFLLQNYCRYLLCEMLPI